jgi:hypothetical protein
MMPEAPLPQSPDVKVTEPVVVVEPGRTIAQNRATQELSTLQARRAELKSQLQSLTERRVLLSVQMRDADGQARSQLQSRIAALDERTARIDNELNTIDDQISQAIGRAAGSPGDVRVFEMPPIPPVPEMPGFPMDHFPGFPARGGPSDAIVPILIGQAVAFVLLSVVIWRAFKRRVAGTAQLSADDANRMEQLQRSVDVMAVEVERIAEGQRYMAKVLSAHGGDEAVGVPRRVDEVR